MSWLGTDREHQVRSVQVRTAEGGHTMSFTPIKSQRAYVQVVDQIVELIKSGEFPAGSQLPVERDLADRLGISRASLREALSALQMLGLVETKHGQGTFVCGDTVAPGSRFDASWLYDEESPFTLLQARKALEPQVASIAALQRVDDDLALLREIQEFMKAKPHDVHRLAQGDRKYHLAIARATANSVLVGLVTLVHELMGQDLWRNMMMTTSFNTPGRWQQAMDEHSRIYAAIEAQEMGLAAEEMTNHLLTVEQVMIEADLARPTEKDGNMTRPRIRALVVGNGLGLGNQV